MARSYIVLSVTAALVAVVVVGVVAVQIGGVSIRSASRTHTLGTLTVANATLLPGVPVTVRIGEEVGIQTPTAILLRLPAASVTVRGISPQEMAARVFTVVLPCEAAGEGETDARLVLVNTDSQAILAQTDQVELLPAGPDCVR